MSRRLLSIVVGTVVVMLAQAGFSFLPPAPPPPGSMLWPLLASNGLIAAVLLELARRLPGSWAARALRLWAAWAGVQVLSLLELLLFDVGLPVVGTLRLCVFAMSVAAPVAAYAAWAAQPPAPRILQAHHVDARWLGLAPPLYLLLYFAAGAAIWSFVANFYQTRPMPPFWIVASVQIVRGLGFGLVVLLLVRTLSLDRKGVAVTAGLTLAILGGIAPLLIPNPYMPTVVRFAHLPETTVSNFLFGVILAWMLRAPIQSSSAAEFADQT